MASQLTTRRWLIVVAAVVVAVLVAGGGFVVWDRTWRHTGSGNPGSTCPVVVAARHRIPLAAIGVHRVMLIGDSIMDESSCSIAESLAGVGIQTSRHGVFGSGLLSGPIDWQTKTLELMAVEKPQVVVAIFVGNVLPPTLPGVAPAAVRAGTPAFFAAWQQHAEALSREIQRLGARLYWVSPPPIAVPPLNNARRLFDGYRRIPGDHVLNSGDALPGSTSTVVSAASTCGRVRVVRAADGVHLTDDGARIYGQTIAHDLSADLGVLTTPKPC